MFFIGLFSSFFPWLILAVVYSLSFGLYYVYSSDKGLAEEENTGKEISIHPGQEAEEPVLCYAAYISGVKDEYGQASAISDEPDEDLAVSLRSGLDDQSSSTGIIPRPGFMFFPAAGITTQPASKAPDGFSRHPDFLLFSRPPPLS